MSTRSTNTAEVLFVTTAPAWEDGCTLEQTMHTDIFRARSGVEQRQGSQGLSKWRMEYTAVLDQTAAAARRARALEEVRSPLCVPFWTEKTTTAGPLSGDSVEITAAETADFFQPGDFVLLSASGDGIQFREIASRAGSVLTFTPDLDAIAYAAGSTVWPCKFCIRTDGGARFDAEGTHAHRETLQFETL